MASRPRHGTITIDPTVLAALQVPVDLRGLGERVDVPDLDLHLTVPDDLEHLPGGRLEVGPRGRVGRERRPGQVERALLGQDADVERRHLARGVPEADHQAEGLQAVERREERVLADRVVDDRHARPAGDLPHPSGDVLPRRDDDVVAAVGPGDRRLLVRADGADDRRPEGLQPLAGDEADPAGGGMEQDRLARLHGVGPADQVLGGHPLEHHGRRDPIGHPFGDRDQHAGREHPGLGIRPGPAAGVGHPVAGLDDRDAGAHGLDDSRPPRSRARSAAAAGRARSGGRCRCS